MNRLPIVLGLSLAVIALGATSCTHRESPEAPGAVDQGSQPAPTPAEPTPAGKGGGAAAPDAATASPAESGSTGPAATSTDWPRFLGPKADGIASAKSINKDWAARPPRELWRVSLSDDGYGGPAAAAGKVFIIDHQGKEDVVRAIDLGRGGEVWTFSYADPERPDQGFTRSTPCYDEGRLFTLGRSGQLHAFDAATGTELWSKDLRRDLGGKPPQWKYAASPIVDGSRLVVLPGGSNSVAVLDKATGDAIWTGGGAFDAGYSTPAIATINGVKQYVVFTGTALTGVNAEDGQLLWQVPWKTQYGVNAAMPLCIGNAVFATSNYRFGGGLFRVGSDGAQQVWFSKEMQSHFSSPIYYKDHIFGTTDPGDLVCMVPADGTVLWRQNGFEKGGIVIVDDVIIALDGGNGDLIMAATSTQSYQELGRLHPLGGQSWTAPIVADGKLIIRNKEAMACLDLM